MARCGSQDDDVIKTAGSEFTRLKEIPVPESVAADCVHGTQTFELPREYIRAPGPSGSAAGSSYSNVPYTYGAKPAAPPLRRGRGAPEPPRPACASQCMTTS